MKKYTISVEVESEVLLKIVKQQLDVSELLKKAVEEEIEKRKASFAEEIAHDIQIINDFTEKAGRFND